MANTKTERRFFRERELEAYSGIPARTLQGWRLRRQGPPYFKLGTGRKAPILYDIGEFMAWLESCRITGAAAAV